MKKTSAKKILANQGNASKSSGPRTARGKEKSRGNAFKHGFFAKIVLPGECEAQYQHLLRKIFDEDKPVGIEEHVLVHQKARAHLFIQRVLRMENLMISGSVYMRAKLVTGQMEEDGKLTNEPVSVTEDDTIGILMTYMKEETYPRIDDLLERYLNRLQTLDNRLEYLRERSQSEKEEDE